MTTVLTCGFQDHYRQRDKNLRTWCTVYMYTNQFINEAYCCAYQTKVAYTGTMQRNTMIAGDGYVPQQSSCISCNHDNPLILKQANDG